MARLQDFQTVTPTDSDNLLVVQATGQGLASVGSTLGAKMDKANPTGTGSLSLNRSGTTGTESVSIGHNCVASGVYSYAEGMETTSSGNTSHAEGYQTTSSGFYSHSEGWKTTASGTESHAEGDATQATGDYSHTEGMGTIAQRRSQHVFGEYNIADTGGTTVTTKGNYIEIVGKGANTNSRSNARTLDWSGNEVLAGWLKVYGGLPVLPSLPQSTGQYNGLIADGQMWAILGQIASGDAAFLFVGHRVGSQVYRKFLFADSGFTYATNAQGTVAIMYNSSVSNIQATAIRLI